MSLDPATSAALEAALVARADERQFAVDVVDGFNVYFDHPIGLAFRPALPVCKIITWIGVYKRRALSGRIACDVAQLSVARCALLQHATGVFDAVDLSLAQRGASSPPVPPVV